MKKISNYILGGLLIAIAVVIVGLLLFVRLAV
jgi:hypothetical protein